jgi:hypothetical protein
VTTTLLLNWGANVQTRSTRISHGGRSWEKETLDEFKGRKMMRRNKKYLSKKYKFTLSSTRGLAKLEEEESITKVKEVDK